MRCILTILLVHVIIISVLGQTDPGLSFSNISKVYGDESFTLTASSGAGSQGTITFSIVGNSDVIALSGDSGETVTINNAGEAVVKATIAQTATHTGAEVNATITVERYPIEVKANDKTFTYGTRYIPGEDYTSQTPMAYNDTEAVLHTSLSAFCIEGPNGTIFDTKSSHILRVNIDQEPRNYRIITPPKDGLLTVTKKRIDFYISDAERTYGEGDTDFTGTSEGFVTGESIANLDPAPQFSCDVDISSDAGSYPINLEEDSHSDWNYELNVIPGVLIIRKAAITLFADDREVTYGEVESEIPNFTFSVNRWIFPTDSDDFSTDPVLTTDATNTTGAGSNRKIFFAQTGIHPNYDISNVMGDLTITPADLAVTVISLSIAYKDDIPSLDTCGVTVTGYKNAESYQIFDQSNNLFMKGEKLWGPAISLSYGGTPVRGANAGSTYRIIMGPTLSAVNYNLEYTNGNLEITKADLGIEIHDINQLVGDVNPPLAHSYTEGMPDHFLDTANLDFSIGSYRVDEDYSQPGSYSINYPVTPGDRNYNIIVEPGTLTVYEKAHFNTVPPGVRACRDTETTIPVVTDSPGPTYQWFVRFPGYGFQPLNQNIIDSLDLDGTDSNRLTIGSMKERYDGYRFRCELTSTFLVDPLVPIPDTVETNTVSDDIYLDLKTTPPFAKVTNKGGTILICMDPFVDGYQWGIIGSPRTFQGPPTNTWISAIILHRRINTGSAQGMTPPAAQPSPR